ncbi:hypothetical protein WDZ92_02055 [Nostoc sp. NIES-2111]
MRSKWKRLLSQVKSDGFFRFLFPKNGVRILRPIAEVCKLDHRFPEYGLVDHFDHAIIWEYGGISTQMGPLLSSLIRATSAEPYWAVFKPDDWWGDPKESPATTVQIPLNATRDQIMSLLRRHDSTVTIDDVNTPWGIYSSCREWIYFSPYPNEISVLLYNTSVQDQVLSWINSLDEDELCIFTAEECNEYMWYSLRVTFWERQAFLKNYAHYDIPEDE